ncbi:MAG: DUF4365 domain-containing protein [Desulfobacterales bacterium]|nr:DUF4365 domain-containing protein [Desulfobacterales bacterium]
MPKRRKLNAVERDGVNYVRNIVEHANCIFNEIHRENDYGNDGFIELVDGEIVTGKCFLVQIKSGKSYNTKNSCAIPASVDHFNYWRSHKLPVIGIVFDPDEQCAFWMNISSFLKRNPLVVYNVPYNLTFPKRTINRFNNDGFVEFFLPIFLEKSIILDYDRSVEFAMSPDFDMHSIGVQSLFYGYRNELSTWDIFEKILKERSPESTTGYLAYIFAHVPGHGDIYWHKNSILNETIEKSLKERFRHYDKDILVPLIRLVDENGFGRASIGQNVYAIIDLSVSDSGLKLLSITNDTDLEIQTQKDALLLYCLVEQEKSEAVLKEIAQRDSELKSWAEELLNHLKKEGFFYP